MEWLFTRHQRSGCRCSTGWEEVRAHLESKIRMEKCDGLNPYKAVEMILKYHPTVPPEYHDTEIYAELTAEQWPKVKVEKADWSDFHQVQRANRYAAKEAIERHAFDDNIGGI